MNFPSIPKNHTLISNSSDSYYNTSDYRDGVKSGIH